VSILFLDTTYDVSIGLLNERLEWLSWERFEGQKASRTLQKEAHSILTKHQVNPRELSAVVTVAGPGFYTGLRLAEGLADVFSFFGIPHYSFYSYELPRWLGVEKGSWFTKAYRGEYFFFDWNESQESLALVTTKELEQALQSRDMIYVHSERALDEKSLSLLPKFISTNTLLEQNSAEVFQRVLKEKTKSESYYFRAPEDEFRVAND
jgi:tRNA threonylcarbamoyladenosine biosynthesis protein TsaB